MKEKRTYAVFGLGRYGFAVAKELVESGNDVIAVDYNKKIINDAAAYLPVCKCADITDMEVISRLGIDNIDTVVICMASNLEASVMAVTLCKEAGVKTIVAKCGNEIHRKILLSVGANQVVFPEVESGRRLAKNLSCYGFIDMLSLSKDAVMIEISVRDEWIGKNLIELNLRKKYGFNVVAVKKDEKVTAKIHPEQPLEAETSLIIIANASELEKFK